MTEPKVLVLMLWVEPDSQRLIRDVTAGLSPSHLVVALDQPLGPQLPPGGWTPHEPEEGLDALLERCPSVIFVVGDDIPVGGLSPEAVTFLKRLIATIDGRARRGDAVGRMRLGTGGQRAPGTPFSYYKTVEKGDAPAVLRYFERTVHPPEIKTDSGGQQGSGGGGRGGSGDVMFGSVGYSGGGPETPAPKPAVVSYSVYAPRLAAPGDEILVQAFALLPGQEGEVAARASAADPAAAEVGSQQLAEPVAEGETLGFHLTMRGVEIDTPDQEFVWRGVPVAAQFCVFFPEGFQPRSAVGTVIVTRGGVPIGHIKFTLEVLTRAEKQLAAPAEPDKLGTLWRYREAFISYATADREKVLPRVQALAAARIRVFQDFIDLGPGERWEKKLYAHIDFCDVFFLFWSQAAKDSEWVCKEAAYAHRCRRGRDDQSPEIIPIIIEGPPPVAPPPELNFLHFNDKYIYLLKGVEAEAEARRKEGT